MGRTCGTYGGEGGCMQGFDGENWDLDRGKLQINIKMDLQKIVWEGVDWIDLAQSRDKWRAIL